MGGAGGWIRIEISKDNKLEIRVGVKQVLEMGMEVVGKARANSGIGGVGFFICIKVDDGNEGRGGKGEDKQIDTTVMMRFMGCTMVGKNAVLSEHGNQRVSEEGDVIGGSSLGAEGGMLWGGGVR